MTVPSGGTSGADEGNAVGGDGRRPIRRALLSVADKTGLVELAEALVRRDVSLVSTGGSATILMAAGLPVQKVEELTGFPEFLDGRVKTLHPRVHGGLLADTRRSSHLDQLRSLSIEPFDLVVVNLYPFRATVASGASPDECIEEIDIGGAAMIRAAAKNHPSVATVVEPADYAMVIAALRAGGFALSDRQRLAAKAYAHTASYDVAVASWMGSVVAPSADGWPRWIGATWEQRSTLRYGENPHQRAALYQHHRPGLASAQQLHGKEMSYNNYVDADAAWRSAHDFADPAAAIIKHTNPCGIAVHRAGDDAIAQAYAKALACDPVSAFGGVVAVNRPVTVALAQQITQVFTEVVVAPAFEPAALDILTTKKNVRVLQMPAGAQWDPLEFRSISGGILTQARDAVDAPGDDFAAWTLAAGPPADPATVADLVFAWRACRSVRSNAIVLAAGQAAVGIGMGQVNRVDSCRLAVQRAGARTTGSVAASDAFFPFADGPEILFRAGVTAVVQPGGSVRDPDVIAAAETAGVSMYFTGVRHFFH